MATIRLKITGTVALGGKRPGEEFDVEATEDGQPAPLYWRRRLNDEALYKCGAVAIVPPPSDTPQAAPAVDAEPPKSASPAPAKKKA